MLDNRHQPSTTTAMNELPELHEDTDLVSAELGEFKVTRAIKTRFAFEPLMKTLRNLWRLPEGSGQGWECKDFGKILKSVLTSLAAKKTNYANISSSSSSSSSSST